MKALVIYDNTGKIYLIMYAVEEVPQGLPFLWVDIPEGAQLERIDLTNPDDPQPIFKYMPESDIGKLQLDVAELKQATQSISEQLNPTIDTETCTLDELIEYTVMQFQKACTQAIYDGCDVDTSVGIKHFSYTDDDQRNLKAAADLAHSTGLQVPYHADGEDCTLWSALDIVKAYGLNEQLKTYHTTYCNLMCNTKDGYLHSLMNKEDILALSYGTPLPEGKQIKLDTAMAQAEIVFNTFISTMNSLDVDYF